MAACEYFITADEECQYVCFCKIPPKSGVFFPLYGPLKDQKNWRKKEKRNKKKKSRQPLKGILSEDRMPQLHVSSVELKN